MKVDTHALIGKPLNWAVAKCEGVPYIETGDFDGIGNFHQSTDFSTDWLQGGPIIEREQITINPGRRGHDTGWTAWKRYEEDVELEGATPLVAAMRCFVASKLGDVVEIPDELIDN